MLKKIGKYFGRTDCIFLLLCISCSVLSVLSLCSISISLGDIEMRTAVVQGAAAAVGLAAAIIISNIDYRNIAQMWPFHVAFAWGLVVLTYFIGYAPAGTSNRAWIELPLGLSLQPTELAKISFILTLALHLYTIRGHINELPNLIKVGLHVLGPVGLILVLQKDAGTALIFLIIGAAMVFSARLSYKYIISALVLVGIGLPAVWFLDSGEKIIKSYQRGRILALFYPDNPIYKEIMYQQKQGLISIGSGQILGRGFFDTNHYAVPLAHNDFIFSYIAQTMGFVGAIIVLVLLFSIVIKGYATAVRSEDELGSYICIGVSTVFLSQTIINVGMNLSVLPVIGITLPLFTAGGTSVSMLYLCIGLVLSVYIHNKKTLFDNM
ncbi:MAG: FtsW/RodA/SpoVE family cell cycle protein [Oscillospiraceae bacterium]|nr:FtsW/RodA/SpoVE family cell cycle protein [Oscillospiraceae bacterium]